MTFLVVLAFFVGFILILYLLSPLIGPKKITLHGKHVLITGGSSGIGKALAIEVVKQGASVTLLARNQTKLSESKDEVEKHFIERSKQRVICISVDLSRDYNNVEKAVRQAEELLGGVSMLINCAGTSVSSRFDDTAITDFKKMMEINYLGTVYATRAVVPSMKSRQEGRIVFVSSQAGQLGLYGYTAYSASKFALRGLAESLQMELKPFNIHVTLTFPPDTDTPGFAEENASKPEETKMISETAGLFQSDYVAKAILQDVIRGKFLSYVGMDGWMLCTVTSGMSPVTTITEAVQQALLMGLFRSISLIYLRYFDYIIAKCKKSKEYSREKSE